MCVCVFLVGFLHENSFISIAMIESENISTFFFYIYSINIISSSRKIFPSGCTRIANSQHTHTQTESFVMDHSIENMRYINKIV